MLLHSDAEQAYYQLSKRVYGSWFASVYGVVVAPFRRLRTRVAALAGIRQGMRVVDVATGTGAQARAFASAGASVLGVDLSARMLAVARRKTSTARVEYMEGDATALPSADASFDAACISFALHEMPVTVRERVIAELVRVTKPNGTIIVVDWGLPKGRVWRAIVERFVHLFERDSYTEFVHSDLRGLLSRVGIEIRIDQRGLLGAGRVVVGTRTRCS